MERLFGVVPLSYLPAKFLCVKGDVSASFVKVTTATESLTSKVVTRATQQQIPLAFSRKPLQIPKLPARIIWMSV